MGAARLAPASLTAAALSAIVGLPARAAEASASPLAGDPRSAGEGPGLVGEPIIAIGLVLAIALAAVIVTTAWVRATSRRDGGAAAGRRTGDR